MMDLSDLPHSIILAAATHQCLARIAIEVLQKVVKLAGRFSAVSVLHIVRVVFRAESVICGTLYM